MSKTNKAAYPLELVHEIINNDHSNVHFYKKENTVNACRAMGISRSMMLEILLELTEDDHHKTMLDRGTDEQLDVYRYHDDDVSLYIKFKVQQQHGKRYLTVRSMKKK